MLAKADTEEDKESKTFKPKSKDHPKAAANRANAANAGLKRPREDQRDFKDKICDFHQDEPRHKNKLCPDKDSQGKLLFGAARKERAKELSDKASKTKKDDKKDKKEKKAKKEKSSRDSETDE